MAYKVGIKLYCELSESSSDAIFKVQKIWKNYKFNLILDHKLISGCPTQWSSTYYMVQQLLELIIKSPISSMWTSPGRPQASLSVCEWSILQLLVEVLQPLEEATNKRTEEKHTAR